jgi:hypothetical protein
MSGARYEVNVTVFPAAIEAIKQGEETRQLVSRRTEDAAFSLRAGAPVRTGAGRASITASTERDFDSGWIGKATWDDEHYYMGILNSRDHWADEAVQRLRYS